MTVKTLKLLKVENISVLVFFIPEQSLKRFSAFMPHFNYVQC